MKIVSTMCHNEWTYFMPALSNLVQNKIINVEFNRINAEGI